VRHARSIAIAGTHFVDVTRYTGSMYVTSPASTVLSTQDVAVKVAGTTALCPSITQLGFSMPANNRLQLDAGPARSYKITCGVTAQSAGTNKTYNWYWYKNGVLLPESCARRKQSVGADDGRLSVPCPVDLTIGDYVELWVSCINSTVSNVSAELFTAVID